MPSLSRRDALHLLASSVAATMASCTQPTNEIIPYVNMPERLIPGEPLKFATSVALAGYGRGTIGITYEGRPTKLEGNPLHPASLGGSDVFMEADILDLYDPARSRAPRGPSMVNSWDEFLQAFEAARAHAVGNGGFRLRVLSGRITSPTFVRLWQALARGFPAARWHRYEPVDDDSETQGLKLAFSRPMLARPRISDANVVLCLGADPLGPGPEQPALARAFSTRRNSEKPGGMLRLYACESAWTLTGANADHRLVLAPAAICDFALAVAARLGADDGSSPSLAFKKEVEAVSDDLLAHRGHAMVLAGRTQPPELHALAAWMNARLGAPIDYIEPVDTVPGTHAGSLAALEHDLESGAVDALVIIGANPAYDRGVEFSHMIGRARLSAHMGLYADETARACRWHLPMSHILESWSDIRGPDGTASIVQPLIMPLYDSRTPEALLALVTGNRSPRDYDLVRQTWNRGGNGDFESWWRGAVERGVIEGTGAKPVTVSAPSLPQVKPAGPGRLVVTTGPDPSIWDGRYANNAWLQECPKPFTMEVWGNAIEVSPEDAKEFGIADSKYARLTCGLAVVDAPVRIRSGQAKGVVAVTLGYGRVAAGPIGDGVGFNAWPLWARRNEPVSLSPIDSGPATHTTFGHAVLDEADDKLFPRFTLAELAKLRRPITRPESSEPTLLHTPQPDDGYAWAMVIDNGLCIGCNACVVSCMAENNVPVVGPDEIDRHRDMHWLRVDTYQSGEAAGLRIGFEPVPCMHCEDAPCEPVCPVEASIHDTEGLNVQVYNRCIGTRFCESNCPYKVRRFNWFDYAGYQAYADMNAGTISAQRNPDVTVRARGVMEKCTYCVQRITRARRGAEREKRMIRDGEVVTACQAACPTGAISFGNRDDKHSHVVAQKSRGQHFALLASLGTRPRTTYLAHVSNPNPVWDKTS
ncbi:MAG TPA: 4Fe-4S dicluster domain-containing protein [Rhizomicrobium sp.]|jgi:molybdopterin-containing oxidoreductase family iron-sulfur binding subunit|nr:4Fe-4S dicluster domain-containing protein [Rhizomicrobium sp.]